MRLLLSWLKLAKRMGILTRIIALKGLRLPSGSNNLFILERPYHRCFGLSIRYCTATQVVIKLNICCRKYLSRMLPLRSTSSTRANSFHFSDKSIFLLKLRVDSHTVDGFVKSDSHYLVASGDVNSTSEFTKMNVVHHNRITCTNSSSKYVILKL